MSSSGLRCAAHIIHHPSNIIHLMSHKKKGSISLDACPFRRKKYILHQTSYFLHRKLVSHKGKKVQ